jgi:hypothetical protein
MVDMADSKSAARKGVGVRLPSPAPSQLKEPLEGGLQAEFLGRGTKQTIIGVKQRTGHLVEK